MHTELEIIQVDDLSKLIKNEASFTSHQTLDDNTCVNTTAL